jgi:putative transposase
VIRTRKANLPVSRCCHLLCVPRASFYRDPLEKKDVYDEELEALSGKHPRFGYRRLAAMSGQSPKRVRRKMEQMGLMARMPKKKVRTTYSVPVDEQNLCPLPVTLGELLVSDFTYIALARGTAFFAVTLDAFSRRICGYSISQRMDTALVLSALPESAPSGFIHHSDRGVQYASSEFRSRIQELGGRSSYSRKAKPGDNAKCESFFARFKDETIRTDEPGSFESLKKQIDDFVLFYNETRPHSSLGNLSPRQFEEQHALKIKSVS